MLGDFYNFVDEIRQLERLSKLSPWQRLKNNFEHDNPSLIANNNFEMAEGDLYVILETGQDGLCHAPKNESDYSYDEILDNVFAYRIKLNGEIDRTMIREVYTERCERDSDPAEGWYQIWRIGSLIGGVKNGN